MRKNKKQKLYNGMVVGSILILFLTTTALGLNVLLKKIETKSAYAGGIVGDFFENPAKMIVDTTPVPKASNLTLKTPPTMREWVEAEVKNAGLDFGEVDCIIQNESNWNNWRYNINKNGSTDMGLWQINSIHKNTCSVECRWDYKCSTHWAIQKRLNDGNWNAWYGYDKCK
jgi:hypothetical protein